LKSDLVFVSYTDISNATDVCMLLEFVTFSLKEIKEKKEELSKIFKTKLKKKYMK